MDGDIYIDGIENIVLSHGMIRMDLASFALRARDAAGNPVIESRQRIVMTPQGFLRTFNALERMKSELIRAGIIKERQDEERRSGPARDDGAAIAVAERRKSGAKGGQPKERRRRTLDERK